MQKVIQLYLETFDHIMYNDYSRSETEEEVEAVGLAAELGDLKDDVVEAEKEEAMEEAKWAQPAMRSEPVNKVFIEQRSELLSDYIENLMFCTMM